MVIFKEAVLGHFPIKGFVELIRLLGTSVARCESNGGESIESLAVDEGDEGECCLTTEQLDRCIIKI